MIGAEVSYFWLSLSDFVENQVKLFNFQHVDSML